MKTLRNILLWYVMLSKRLMKKSTFLLLLCAIPLLVIGIQVVSGQESGMLTIILCMENPEDELSGRIVEDLLENKGIINYQTMDDVKEAYSRVEGGKADAVWIFPDNMQEELNLYTAGGYYENNLIHIVEREDNVALQLAREKLYGAMYSYVSYSIYRNFIRNEIPNGEEASEEELLSHYEASKVEGDLFQFSFVNGRDSTREAEEANYLTAPLRGMLALVVILCGLAAAMYYLQDEQAGVFARVAKDARGKYFYAYELTAMAYAGIAVMLAYYFSGIWTRAGVELRNMLLYLLACSIFCRLIARFCGKIQRLGSLIPILMLLMFVLCPVFFAVKELSMLSGFFPPFYYLNSIHNDYYFIRLVFYCVIGFIIDFVIEKLISLK